MIKIEGLYRKSESVNMGGLAHDGVVVAARCMSTVNVSVCRWKSYNFVYPRRCACFASGKAKQIERDSGRTKDLFCRGNLDTDAAFSIPWEMNGYWVEFVPVSQDTAHGLWGRLASQGFWDRDSID